MDIEITNEAEKDLISIYQYGLTNVGQAAAERYFVALKSSIEKLADFPFMGIKRDELSDGMHTNDVPMTIRSWAVKSHTVYYQIQANRLLVIRVLHQSMDDELIFLA